MNQVALKKRQQPHPITEGVWMWSMDYGYGETFFNSYLLKTGKNQAVLVDPLFNSLDGKPLMDWSVFDDLPKPQAIWLTNSDHERDSEEFHKHFRIPVLGPKQEAGQMSIRLDEHFKDEESLDGGWQVIFLKDQKTPAECVFYHPERQLLLVGDALLSQADGRLRRPYDEPAYASEAKAQQGLQVLSELPVKGILVGHGDPVFKNAKDLLQDALNQDPRSIAQ